jgi:ATPase subunit of ABC transporter with duplicated ATPase domains
MPKRVVPTFWEISSLILVVFTRSATALGAAAVGFGIFSKVGLLNFFFTSSRVGISAMNWLMQATNESNIGTIRGALAKMLLTQDQADKLVDVLSGGEAARLLFAKIMLEQGNVLVLDEPTNHIDLESRTALANSLKSFEGTIIFVSHDRHFISTVANRIIEITPKGIIDKRMSYDEYISDKAIKEQRASMYV